MSPIDAFREILAPTAVAFAIYTGFMLIRGLVQFSELLIQSSHPILDTGLVVAFSLPHIVVLTLPIAFLLGILVGVGRDAADTALVTTYGPAALQQLVVDAQEVGTTRARPYFYG